MLTEPIVYWSFLRPVSLKSNILVKCRFSRKALFSQECGISRKYVISALFRPVYQISGPRTLPKSLFLARGAKIALWSTFSVKKHFFGENREIPPFLQKIQKIAKVASFCAGARNAYRTNDILTILGLILLKSRILAKMSENERASQK